MNTLAFPGIRSMSMKIIDYYRASVLLSKSYVSITNKIIVLLWQGKAFLHVKVSPVASLFWPFTCT